MTQDRRIRLPLAEPKQAGRVASPETKSRQSERQGPRAVCLELGRTVVTPGALALLEDAGKHPMEFLARHASGDWGELCGHDRQANRDALKTGARVLSCYHLGDDRLRVITEAVGDDGHRASTCVLLPDEY